MEQPESLGSFMLSTRSNGLRRGLSAPSQCRSRHARLPKATMPRRDIPPERAGTRSCLDSGGAERLRAGLEWQQGCPECGTNQFEQRPTEAQLTLNSLVRDTRREATRAADRPAANAISRVISVRCFRLLRWTAVRGSGGRTWSAGSAAQDCRVWFVSKFSGRYRARSVGCLERRATELIIRTIQKFGP